MKRPVLHQAIPIGVIVIGGASVLLLWLGRDAGALLKLRMPIAENQTQDATTGTGDIASRGQLLTFGGVPADIPGAWPQFRGPNLDAISEQPITLARQWPEKGPKLLWSLDLGQGYAGAAVRNGRVYVLDYDQTKNGDAIRCFSLADAQEIWRYFYPVKVKRNHGMSRTVPAVTDQYVVTLGPKCHVVCLDAATGRFRWAIDLVREYGVNVPPWYAGQCPLVEDGKVILGVGGRVLMMAVDCETGQVIWQTPNPHHWEMTHSSVVPLDFGGVRQYVYCASGGVVGVSAKGGSLLWETADWKITIANVPSPLVIGQGRIFLSGGYNSGAILLQLTQEGDRFGAKIVYRLAPEVFGSPQHTPILYGGHIYGVRPDGQLACLDLDGNVLWTSTSAHKFGLGPYTLINGLLYVMNDVGLLTLAEATPTGYVQLDEAKVLDGPDAWGPMAVVGSRLILRDLNRMICLDITADGNK